jgi:hypothetical protein
MAGQTCNCQHLIEAGWRVNCSACGRREFTDGALIDEFTTVRTEAMPSDALLASWAADDFTTLHLRDFSTDAECAETAEAIKAELARRALVRDEAERRVA